MDEAPFNTFILTNMPYFIAVNYQRLLETQDPPERVELILHIYNLILRTLTINMVSQYLIRDREDVNDSYLNDLLKNEFPDLSLGICQKIFFALLRAYKNQSKRFFMPELYTFYWDTSTTSHRPRLEMEHTLERLTQVALEIQSGRILPKNEAEWSALAYELLGLLKDILSSLSFIEKYDLIRVLDFDQAHYRFELHRGVQISLEHQLLPKAAKFKRGYFYLRSRTEQFLHLYPLLMFWERGTKEYQSLLPDTGIYDRIIYDEQLQYLLSKPGRKIVDDNERTFKDFVKLLHATLEEIKRQRQGTETLTWWHLQDICQEITLQRTATVQQKFRKELYLQRDKTRQEFEKFLKSKKRCFVLIGKSGVGKSNFLLALLEELQQSRSDICVLMYDGANLSAERTVTGVVGQDFDNRLIVAERQIQNIWREIAKIEGMKEGILLLCVDAINENPMATELLRQLDELVQAPWPWLKIVFTSRPETWQTIKRGVKLAEALYYQGQGVETIGVRLEPFSCSDRMEPFSRQELPLAYAKYQKEFNIQTPYEALSAELRELLREPLNLWLVASIYRGEAVPSSLKVTTLIEKYVEELLETHRLKGEDLRFLEKELIPLMVREGHYSNEITAADIDAVGDRLYLLINSEQVLSDGQRVNQSFTNLLDTDILVRQRQGRNQKIAFKFERFYEYFISGSLLQLSQIRKDRYTFFQELIEKTNETPFLWGAVRNALVQEVKKRGYEMFVKLCFTEQQRVKDMMVSVLMRLGSEDRTQVEDILKSLMPQEKNVHGIQKIQQLLGKSDEATDGRSRNARKIAIEVASNLNIPWVLQSAALQADPTIRTVAVRYTYHLWQHDRIAGFRVLEHLAMNVTSGVIPNFIAFESTLGLSTIIFFGYHRDESVLLRLQSIWRKIIASILRIREGNNRLGGAVREFIRERLISFVMTVAFGLFRELPGYNVVSYKGLEAFFQLGATEKALYRDLIQYFDIEGGYSKEQMESDFLRILKIDNLHITLVAVMALVAHACSAPLEFLPFLKKLFEEAKKEVVSYSYLTDIANVVENVLVCNPMNDELFDFFLYTIEVCQEYYTKYPQAIRNRLSEAPSASYIGPYVFQQYRRTGDAKTAWLKRRIDAALVNNNISFFDLLLTTELPLVGIERQRPRAALDILDLFFTSNNEKINEMIQAFLARMRLRYPDEVDDFLEEQHAPERIRLQVRTNEPVERVGELIGEKSWAFLRDDILMDSTELRSVLIRVFDKAADCKNLREWVDYFIREVINLIYGGEALRQAK